MLKAKIFNSPEKCMAGAELRRLRLLAGLSHSQLAEEVKVKGWDCSRMQLWRLEKKPYFCKHPQELGALLEALKAQSL